MNLLTSLIPAPYQLAARIAIYTLLAALCFGAGWKVKSVMDAAALADLKVQHANLVADATARSLAAQHKADADHATLAAALSKSSATFHQSLAKAQHENDLLRSDVAAGTRVVRVAATCPSPAADLPQAASGGRVDPGAGAVLSAADGQTVLDLRARITGTETQLAACQAAVRNITGQ